MASIKAHFDPSKSPDAKSLSWNPAQIVSSLWADTHGVSLYYRAANALMSGLLMQSCYRAGQRVMSCRKHMSHLQLGVLRADVATDCSITSTTIWGRSVALGRNHVTSRMKFVVTSFVVAISAAVVVLGGGGAGAQTSPGDYTCDFPAKPPAAGAPQKDFDTYSWRMFVALNWPAASGNRGVPDCAKPFGSSSETVWRSYKFTDEIFLPGAKDPGKWNTPQPAVRMSEIAKASKAVTKSVLGPVMQPVGGWLIDQQGNPTFYQIAVDRTSYDYIVTNELYNADIANADSRINFPNGSTEIKTSWRILTSQDDSSRYLSTIAVVDTFDASGKVTGAKKARLGLVGLHILTKAPGFPQWIWATFEQVDNVATPPGGKASYSNPLAPPADVNQSPCAGHRIPCTPKPGKTFQSPDPLARSTPIAAVTAEFNRSVQRAFPGTFLQYYELISTQRPNSPDDPGNPMGTPTPNILANTTMESYIQPTSSCMACHSTAVSGSKRNKSDFSFVFLHAQSPTK